MSLEGMTRWIAKKLIAWEPLQTLLRETYFAGWRDAMAQEHPPEAGPSLAETVEGPR